MKCTQYVRRVDLECDADEAFAWHAREGALERLMPPWESAEVVARTGQALAPGSVVKLRMRLGPLSLIWEAEHGPVVEGRSFSDRQLRGPFAQWEHSHVLTPSPPGRCTLEDRILYRLPAGRLGHLLAGASIRSRLDRLFDYRHATTRSDLSTHRKTRMDRMRIVISGATGLVGSHLVPFLTTGGHEAWRLTRRPAAGADGDIPWDHTTGTLDGDRLEGLDGVVHLAGESIAEGRWSDAKKRRIRASRVDGTRLLCETLARLQVKPRVLVAASAIGWYGDRGAAIVDEMAPAGDDFLASVCRDWEAATQPARDAGIRVVNLRIGMVLSPRGGALGKMLTPFRLGAGGVIGSGEQYMSWIGIDDLVGAIHHALTEDGLSGPVNAVTPHPVTNREFTKTLGSVLNRPTVLPMPGFAARLAFGEMADALLLGSTRVAPGLLRASKYDFRHPRLEDALRHLLGKPARTGVDPDRGAGST